ncbi:MAG TPA: CoA transferase, partial [Xanthobacteraceae bacterium]|nr:CoA transferase [Xanthobacteraceae bacterium]
EIDFPNGARGKIPRLPIEIGAHDFALRRQAPAMGEHTEEILAELGLAPGEIEALRKRGVIATASKQS